MALSRRNGLLWITLRAAGACSTPPSHHGPDSDVDSGAGPDAEVTRDGDTPLADADGDADVDSPDADGDASYLMGHRALTMTDSTGSGDLPVQIYYPALETGEETPFAEGTFPVVVFAHGYQLLVRLH